MTRKLLTFLYANTYSNYVLKLLDSNWSLRGEIHEYLKSIVTHIPLYIVLR